MIRIFMIAMTLMVVSSAEASASMKSFQATLANPPKRQIFVSGNTPSETAVWHCKGTNCVTTSDVTEAKPKALCRRLVKLAGPVASFGGLDSAELQACNGTK